MKDSIYWDLSLISSIFSPGLDFKQNQMIPSNIMSKGANRYQKVVGQNGAGKGILGLFLP